MPSGLTFAQARDLARAPGGPPVRREPWRERWLDHHAGWWWLTPVDPATLALGEPRIVQADDLAVADFLARDWTTEPLTLPDPGVLLAVVLLPVKVYITGWWWVDFDHFGWMEQADWRCPPNAPQLAGTIATEADTVLALMPEPVLSPPQPGPQPGFIPSYSGVEVQAIDALGRNVFYGWGGGQWDWTGGNNSYLARLRLRYQDCRPPADPMTPQLIRPPSGQWEEWVIHLWEGDPPQPVDGGA